MSFVKSALNVIGVEGPEAVSVRPTDAVGGILAVNFSQQELR